MKGKNGIKTIVSTAVLYASSLVFIFIFHQVGRFLVNSAGVNLSLFQWFIFPAVHAYFLVFMTGLIFMASGQAQRMPRASRVAGLIFVLHLVILFVSRALVGPHDVEVSWHAPIVAGIQAFGPNIQHDPWTAFVILKRNSFLLTGPLLLAVAAVGLNKFGGPNHSILRTAAR